MHENFVDVVINNFGGCTQKWIITKQFYKLLAYPWESLACTARSQRQALLPPDKTDLGDFLFVLRGLMKMILCEGCEPRTADLPDWNL